jgi:hypothetical protein
LPKIRDEKFHPHPIKFIFVKPPFEHSEQIRHLKKSLLSELWGRKKTHIRKARQTAAVHTDKQGSFAHFIADSAAAAVLLAFQ